MSRPGWCGKTPLCGVKPAGARMCFVTRGPRISGRRVKRTMTDSASGIAINEDTAALVNGALEHGTPMLLAYVDTKNQAHLSFRGSPHVHSPDQLAIWVRNAEGGLQAALDNNPQLTLMYRDPPTRTTIFFYGRGRVENDDAHHAIARFTTPVRSVRGAPIRGRRRACRSSSTLTRYRVAAPDARIDMRRA